MTQLHGANPPRTSERLPPMPSGTLTADQRDLYDAILAGERARGDRPIPLKDDAGHLAGPFNAMLYSPALGRLLEAIGRTLRYETELPTRLREIAILAVAASEGCSYEWIVHSHQAGSMGLSETDLEVIAGRAPGQLSDEGDRHALAVVREILETGDLSESGYAEAQQRLGDAGLLELIVLIGHYRLLALILRLFRQPPVNALTSLGAAVDGRARSTRSVDSTRDSTRKGDSE